MGNRKKYYLAKKEAIKARNDGRKNGLDSLCVFKMPKGSRKAGMYAVCSELEYLNTY